MVLHACASLDSSPDHMPTTFPYLSLGLAGLPRWPRQSLFALTLVCKRRLSNLLPAEAERADKALTWYAADTNYSQLCVLITAAAKQTTSSSSVLPISLTTSLGPAPRRRHAITARSTARTRWVGTQISICMMEKSGEAVLKSFEIDLPHDPASPLLGMSTQQTELSPSMEWAEFILELNLSGHDRGRQN